jgi:hypothetical protein
MNARYLVVSALAVIIFVGCQKPIDGAYFSKTFIHVYLLPDTLRCHWESEYDVVVMGFYGKKIDGGDNEFEELSEKFGDTYFNRKLVPFSNRAIADEFTSIDITSDRDFDSEHPAGTSLGNLVKFYGISFWKYIENGYKFAPYDTPNVPDELNNHTHNLQRGEYLVFKKLSDLEPQDMKLLSLFSTKLYFQTRPSEAGTHNFTVTAKTAEKTFSGTLKVEF